MAVFGFAIACFAWIDGRNWNGTWETVSVLACVLMLFGARSWGARLMRKLDGRRYGSEPLQETSRPSLPRGRNARKLRFLFGPREDDLPVTTLFSKIFIDNSCDTFLRFSAIINS
jgi:hypothetical protein